MRMRPGAVGDLVFCSGLTRQGGGPVERGREDLLALGWRGAHLGGWLGRALGGRAARRRECTALEVSPEKEASGRCGTLWLLIPWPGRKRRREAGMGPSTREQHLALWELHSFHGNRGGQVPRWRSLWQFGDGELRSSADSGEGGELERLGEVKADRWYWPVAAVGRSGGIPGWH